MKYVKRFDKNIIPECEVFVRDITKPIGGKYILKEFPEEGMYGIHYNDGKALHDTNYCYFKSPNKEEVENLIIEWNKKLQKSLKPFAHSRSSCSMQ